MTCAGFQVACNFLAACFAIIAAVLWIKSAHVDVWADGQAAPRRDNIVIEKDGRPYDVSGTAQAQSLWSARAAYAAAIAAVLQAAALLLALNG